MRKINMILLLNSFLYLQIFAGCHYHESILWNETISNIDSFIEVRNINAKTIIVTFGADAITAINTNNGIVVIDAGISSGLTLKYRHIIEKKFQKNNFIYVINTHGHPDHVGGNNVFPNATILGQINSINEISEHNLNLSNVKISMENLITEYDSILGAAYINAEDYHHAFTQKTRYQSALNDILNDIPLKIPNSTFSDSMDVFFDDISLNLFYFGRCHSKSDILIYAPELKILFTGDLFSEYGRPSYNNPLFIDKELCKRGVSWIKQRMGAVDVIIGGHGQILSEDDLNLFVSNILSLCNQ
ncbi:MAG: MBL fold metallo-hydrolase [Bacteroidales bacterium]|nr:MBL fold metallo-hydrolase [Bacteroidales bacterium]